jgi:hypothetical protein
VSVAGKGRTVGPGVGCGLFRSDIRISPATDTHVAVPLLGNTRTGNSRSHRFAGGVREGLLLFSDSPFETND